MKKKAILSLLLFSILIQSADQAQPSDEKKNQLSEEERKVMEWFEKHRNKSVASMASTKEPTRVPIRRICSATLLFHKQQIDVPGETYFHSAVCLCVGNDPLLWAVLSGNNEKAVHAVAAEFPFVRDNKNNIHNRLALAIRAALNKDETYKEYVQDMRISPPLPLKRLCSIVLPAELQSMIPVDTPCKHESEEVCKQYSANIVARIKALAASAPVTHKALVMVPYFRPACLSTIE